VDSSDINLKILSNVIKDVYLQLMLISSEIFSKGHYLQEVGYLLAEEA
jgi:hypothetical protein